MQKRKRKSKFIRFFDKVHPTMICPGFYELILSNGCPYNCVYCYLKGTFRGKTNYVTWTNSWDDVKKELNKGPPGVYNTGELSDSLAILPSHFNKVVDYLLLA